MDMLYQEGKAAPPLFKNQPPVAGSIFWERSLFLRMKNTIIKFLTMDEMMLTERGKAVSISLNSLADQSMRLAKHDDSTCHGRHFTRKTLIGQPTICAFISLCTT